MAPQALPFAPGLLVAPDRGDPAQQATEQVGSRRSSQFSKTKMCRFHLMAMCTKGTQCPFAHSKEELKPLPDLTCTKLCKVLIQNGECHIEDCKYAHTKEELRATSTFHKTKLCRFMQMGHCALGVKCNFAHSLEEVRQLEADIALLEDIKQRDVPRWRQEDSTNGLDLGLLPRMRAGFDPGVLGAAGTSQSEFMPSPADLAHASAQHRGGLRTKERSRTGGKSAAQVNVPIEHATRLAKPDALSLGAELIMGAGLCRGPSGGAPVPHGHEPLNWPALGMPAPMLSGVLAGGQPDIAQLMAYGMYEDVLNHASMLSRASSRMTGPSVTSACAMAGALPAGLPGSDEIFRDTPAYVNPGLRTASDFIIENPFADGGGVAPFSFSHDEMLEQSSGEPHWSLNVPNRIIDAPLSAEEAGLHLKKMGQHQGDCLHVDQEEDMWQVKNTFLSFTPQLKPMRSVRTAEGALCSLGDDGIP